MTKRNYWSAGVFALALMICSATVRVSTASASLYMIGMGITGEVLCVPGGNDDCGAT